MEPNRPIGDHDPPWTVATALRELERDAAANAWRVLVLSVADDHAVVEIDTGQRNRYRISCDRSGQLDFVRFPGLLAVAGGLSWRMILTAFLLSLALSQVVASATLAGAAALALAPLALAAIWRPMKSVAVLLRPDSRYESRWPVDGGYKAPIVIGFLLPAGVLMATLSSGQTTRTVWLAWAVSSAIATLVILEAATYAKIDRAQRLPGRREIARRRVDTHH